MGGLSAGQIIGIVIGCVAFIVILALIIFCCCRSHVFRGGIIPQPGVAIATYTPPIVSTTIITTPPPVYPPPIQPAYQAPLVQPQYYPAQTVY